jgi:cytochrome bd-type quinol oxidase subunit 1
LAIAALASSKEASLERTIVFFAFRIMVGVGFLLLAIAITGGRPNERLTFVLAIGLFLLGFAGLVIYVLADGFDLGVEYAAAVLHRI